MQTGLRIAALIIAVSMSGASCSTLRSLFALDSGKKQASAPIENPFGEYYPGAQAELHQNMILRTKKGDRSIELELPKSHQEMSDLVIPVNPAFNDGRSAAFSSSISPSTVTGPEMSTDGLIDESYRARAPGLSDRELTQAMPTNLAEDDAKRREVEQSMGLVPSDTGVPVRENSYLAAIDHIKQLYKYGRIEAALLELDELLRLYQTDPKLYSMRGTLLDRLGKSELALKSWNQSLRFDPSNNGLKQFIERRQQRTPAGGTGVK
ncbi:tetratricopeptide repeat protein [Bdellovibrionota bacterium FG-2]